MTPRNASTMTPPSAGTTVGAAPAAASGLAIRWSALRPDAERGGLRRATLVARLDGAADLLDLDRSGADAPDTPVEAALTVVVEHELDAPDVIEDHRRVEVRRVRTGDGALHADVANGTGEVLLAVSLDREGRLLFARTPLLERAGFQPGEALPPEVAGG